MHGEERLIFELIGAISVLAAWLVSIYRVMYKVQSHIDMNEAHFVGSEKMRVMAHIEDKTIHGSEQEHIDNEVRLVRLESKIDNLSLQITQLAKEIKKQGNGKSK